MDLGEMPVQSESPPLVISKRTTSLLQAKKEPVLGFNTFSDLLNSFIGREGSPTQINDYITEQETRLDKLDASARNILETLERENTLLELNPKTILPDAASIMTQSNFTDFTTEGTIDVEFWESLMEDDQYKRIPALLQSKVRCGIPSSLRPKIWCILCEAQVERMKLLYPNLLKDDSAFDRMIQRDLSRTFPKLELFQGKDSIGQQKLYNLLKAYSVYDEEVGYCQGLSFVVGPLIMQNIEEVEAFSIFVRLLEEPKSFDDAKKPSRYYGLRSLYLPQMTGLHLLIHQHTRLTEEILPKLHAHFEEHSVTATMYASQWYLTIFAYNFPFSLVFRIFDIIFSEGAVLTMLKFGIALLQKNEEELLKKSEMEEILDYLKTDLVFSLYQHDFEELVRDAMQLSDRIHEQVLESYKKEYEDEATKASELHTMKSLVVQLRSDSRRMLAKLRELNERNEQLERENAAYAIFKKGANLEIDALRNELDQLHIQNEELQLQDSSLKAMLQ